MATYSFVVQLDWPDPPPCEEYGRTTRAYVSAYQRDRVHQSRLVRGEKRCLVANFNGAIPPGRSIVSATWRCDQNQSVYMSDARIDGRCTTVTIAAQIGYGSRMKCQVTLDNGEVYNQVFWVRIYTTPFFSGETTSYTQGPVSLTVTA
jgi:hypothetical protein